MVSPALVRVAIPAALALSGVVAWLNRGKDDDKPQWRDDSLDDWRQQRDAERERERQSPDGSESDREQ
jgi:hypothetical protein